MTVIGIAACRKLEDYRQSILHVGGEPRTLDSSMPIEQALTGIDGLMLTGGGDVAPSRYGEAAHESVEEAEPGRDEFEIALTLAARARNLPILAICRGVQVLNVACGGTLVQDIPSQIAGALAHSLPVPQHQPYELAHEVWVDKDSLLAKLMRDRLVDEALEVNSRHHQAVKAVAPGFTATATAPDGVVEAIEDPAARFCLGVQWHPEFFIDPGDRRIFDALIAACHA
jgi:putative glutamine amidotransferase